MSGPIEHELGHGRRAFEYSIPFDVITLPDSIPQPQIDWLERFKNKTPGEIHQILASDWARFRAGPGRTISDYLLTRTPSSVVHTEDMLWIGLHSDHEATDTISLAAPMLRQAEQGEFQVEQLDDLQFHFWNLMERITPPSNTFMVSRGGVSEEEFEGCGPWSGSLVVYYVLNGDCFLLNPKGEVGRWLHEFSYDPNDAGFSDGSCVEPVFESFNSFVAAWIEYLGFSFEERKHSPFW